MLKGYRASLLWFADPVQGADSIRYEEDGLLVVGLDDVGCQVVQALGEWHGEGGDEALHGTLVVAPPPRHRARHCVRPRLRLCGLPGEPTDAMARRMRHRRRACFRFAAVAISPQHALRA